MPIKPVPRINKDADSGKGVAVNVENGSAYAAVAITDGRSNNRNNAVPFHILLQHLLKNRIIPEAEEKHSMGST